MVSHVLGFPLSSIIRAGEGEEESQRKDWYKAIRLSVGSYPTTATGRTRAWERKGPTFSDGES